MKPISRRPTLLDLQPSGSVSPASPATNVSSPLFSDTFKKLNHSIQLRFGYFYKSSSGSNSPSPIDEYSPHIADIDLKRLQRSKSSLQNDFATTLINKIKEKGDLPREFYAPHYLSESELESLRQNSSLYTSSNSSFHCLPLKNESSFDEIEATTQMLNAIRFKIENAVTDRLHSGGIKNSLDLSLFKIKIMEDLQHQFPSLKQNKEVFTLVSLHMAASLQKYNIRLTPANAVEQNQLRDIQARFAALSLAKNKAIIPPVSKESTDLLVVGAGPGGLWGALKALDAGKSVTLVEKRSTFDRMNVLVLNTYARTRVLQVAKELQNMDTPPKIHSRDISQIIASLNAGGRIKAKDLQALLLAKAQTSSLFTLYNQVEIDSLDGNAQAAILVDQHHQLQQLAFKHVIHSDGVASTSHQQLVQDTHLEGFTTKGHFENSKNQAESSNFKYQGAMYMSSRTGAVIFAAGQESGSKFSNIGHTPEIRMAHLKFLKTFGWKEDRLPDVILQTDSSTKNVWVAGERPEKVKSKEALEDWFKAVLSLHKPELQFERKIGALHISTLNFVMSELKTYTPFFDVTEQKQFSKISNSLLQHMQYLAENQSTILRSQTALEHITDALQLLCGLEGRAAIPQYHMQRYHHELQRFERKLRKENLNGAIFENQLHHLSPHDSVKSFGLEGSGTSFLIGDAFINPNFHFGHGASDAMMDAENAVATITMKENNNPEALAFYRGKLENRYHRVMQMFNS